MTRARERRPRGRRVGAQDRTGLRRGDVEGDGAEHRSERQRVVEGDREHGVLGQVLDRTERGVEPYEVGVVEDDRRDAGAERHPERASSRLRVRADDDGEPVLLGEAEQAVGEQLLGLRDVEEGERRSAVPRDLEHRGLGDRLVDVLARAGAQHDVGGQDGVTGPRRGGEEVGDRAQRRLPAVSG